jgi:hypothetical protein
VHVTSTALSTFSAPADRGGAVQSVTVEIGGIAILLRSTESAFCRLVARRYGNFVNPSALPDYEFEVNIETPASSSDEDARVWKQGRLWHFVRGDFRAEWDAQARRGRVRQSLNPYSIDTVLRIVHSLVLAEEGGFLLHAASALRSGKAFLFTGVSGAGKTTISRLAPPDAAVLTDEISYVRVDGGGYRGYGTPFAGELARIGANVSAPLGALYFLEQGPVNRIEPIGRLAAARALLRNVLFFAHDPLLVERVFHSALEFVSSVEVARLVFRPEQSVWELIG